MSMNTDSIISSSVLATLISTAQQTPEGVWVEVGVYRGGSALRLYNVLGKRELHLFDTFSGIPICEPDKGDSHGIGEFNGSEVLEWLRDQMPRAQFHVGLFPDTLPDALTGIAFAHIDCDQYRSVLDCIDYLWPRMVPGGVMWFDDMSFLEGARRAVMKHFMDGDLHEAPEGRRFAVK